MPVLHVVRVFVGEDGAGGNPLGVFMAGEEVPESERQRVATELGFSETVYVDDPARGELRLYTPATELPFAGHPMVGTAWLLRNERVDCTVLRPPAGEVGVRYEGERTWITGRPEWAPDLDYFALGSPEEVDRLEGPPPGSGAAFCWAWFDEEAGRVRARGLYPALGIEEDEATGAAALSLSARLGRPLEIHQGEGSLLLARPLDRAWVEVGGVTELAEVRDLAL
jgi:predicted PhzF superfamily epimerase YddE/YHI9